MDPLESPLPPPSGTDGLAVRDSFKSRGGLGRLLPATGYALQGLKAAWVHEAAFRQELFIGLGAVIASFWIAPSFAVWVVMNLSILFVLCLELVNSAIEAVADAVSMQRHPLLGRAKDMGSAAVLIGLLIAVMVWISAIYVRLSG